MEGNRIHETSWLVDLWCFVVLEILYNCDWNECSDLFLLLQRKGINFWVCIRFFKWAAVLADLYFVVIGMPFHDTNCREYPRNFEYNIRYLTGHWTIYFTLYFAKVYGKKRAKWPRAWMIAQPLCSILFKHHSLLVWVFCLKALCLEDVVSFSLLLPNSFEIDTEIFFC